MTALLIVGALLWAVVLLALARRLTEQRRAYVAYRERCAERDRRWREEEAERMALWSAIQHAQCMARLEVIALDTTGGQE